MVSNPSVQNRLAFIVPIACMGVVFVTWNLLPFLTRHPTTGFVSQNPDVLLYGRWLIQSLERGAIVTDTDHYTAFPVGMANPRAPLMMWLLLNFTWMFYRLFPDSGLSPLEIAGFLPALIGILAYVWMVVVFWRVFRSRLLSVLLAITCLPSGMTIMTFRYGEVDHHFLESLFLFWWFGAGLLWLHERRRGWLYFGSAGLVGMIFAWTGAPLALTLGAVLAFVAALAWGEDYFPILEYVGGSALVAGGLLWVWLFAQGRPVALTMEFHGHFQAFFALGIGVFAKLANQALLRWGRQGAIPLGLAGVATGSVAIAWGVPGFAGEVRQGLALLFNQHPVFQSIAELQSSIKSGPDLSRSLIEMLNHFGPLAVLLPAGVVLTTRVFIDGWGKPPQRAVGDAAKVWPATVWTWLWVGAVMLLVLFQRRYARWEWPFLPWGFAMTVSAILAAVRCTVASPARRWAQIAFLGPVLLAVVIRAGMHQNEVVAVRGSGELSRALVWLQRNSPETAGWRDDRIPEYGVLSFWDKGNAVSFFARRPAICNNTLLGLGRMAKAFLAPTEDAAYRECREVQARYVVMDAGFSLPGRREMLEAMVAASAKGDFIRLDEKAEPGGMRDTRDTVLCDWLWEGHGLRQIGAWQGASRFRWIYTNRASRIETIPVDLFEVVAGACLRLASMPAGRLGEPGHAQGHPATATTDLEGCEAMLPVKVGDRVLLYRRRFDAEAGGEWRNRIPYPTGSRRGGIETAPLVFVTFGRDREVIGVARIGDPEVQTGAEVQVTLLDGARRAAGEALLEALMHGEGWPSSATDAGGATMPEPAGG